MKTILLSQRLVEVTEYQEVREALDVRWGAFLRECGLIPVAVAARVPAGEYFAALKPSGVLLTGGNDLAVYAKESALSRERDAVESALIDEAVKHNVPVIGVCRGMQMLSFYYGLSLESRSGHIGKNHGISIQSGSRLSRFYKNPQVVNSYHQYCVTGVSEDFAVAAQCEDQTVEAFEHKSKKIFGMMWHPERMNPFSADDIAFFRSVFSV